MRRITFAIALCIPTAVSAQEADHWSVFVTDAADRFGDTGKRAAEFLRKHRPERDRNVSPIMLLHNLQSALRARETYPWARELDEAMFFNDVLPYAVLDETREDWRRNLQPIAAKIVADCKTATDAAQALNREFFDEINVHYNTGRKKPNQSPYESMEQGRATCTGLSILLVNACRSVGVAARIAGVSKWNGKDGNHTWVEIWDGKSWRFTGADEYDAKGLDRAWFVGDAKKAVAGDPRMAVRATSWAATGEPFVMAWSPRDRSVPGVDVTERYTGDAESAVEKSYLRVWRGDDRVACTVRVYDAASGKQLASAETRAGRADLNDMPAVELPRGKRYRFVAEHEGVMRDLRPRYTAFEPGTLDLDEAETLRHLTREEADELLAKAATERLAEIAEERGAELEAKAFTDGKHELEILEKTFGDAPQGKRSLWISMHGGGGAPPKVNDQQWRNQIRLYELDEGIYVAPRAPTDTWNLWHQAHIDGLFDRMIETYVATRGVDPDRVYLLGYSAGGDGVYQLAPRMADRFAAASMMAGHPNETKPHGLRNLPFALFMGGKDSAYKRNEVAQRFGDELAALQKDDPEGYPHRLTIYPECGHWMNGQDREGLPWMAKHTRTAWPKRVVWRQDDVVHDRFYWLAVDRADAAAGQTITATVDGQDIVIESETARAVTLRLRDGLVDLDRPVRVLVGDEVKFEGSVPRTEAAIRASLEQRADIGTAATATLRVEW